MNRPLLLLCLPAFTACTSLSPEVRDLAADHTVMASPKGRLVSPSSHRKELDKDAADAYLDNLIRNLQIAAERSTPEPLRVLIFIHGGLNQSKQSILRAACWAPAIMADADELPNCRNFSPPGDDPALSPEGHYPIFINWRSWLVSTYGEHLVATRQGERWRPLWGWLSAPFVFIADVGRALTRAPVVWMQEAKSGVESYRGTPPFGEKKVVYRHYLELNRRMREDSSQEQIQLSIGKDHGPPGVFAPFERSSAPEPRDYYDPAGPDGSWTEGAAGFLSAVVTLPTKALLTPLIDSAGRPAWTIMNRRTELLRRQPQEYDSLSQDNEIYLEPTGAVGKFLDRLAEAFPRDHVEQQIEVTLIGHSMGTIVANWIVADYGDQLQLKNVVYMASASTISEVERNVVPHMMSDEGRSTEFFNLTLHPRAEVRERNLDIKILDFAPRGSLLVWIDNYLSTPESFLDRTVGRWDNIIVAPHIFPEEIRCRVHIKAFGVDPWGEHTVDNPQRHGDFTLSPFWRPEYWEPKVPNDVASCQ